MEAKVLSMVAVGEQKVIVKQMDVVKVNVILIKRNFEKNFFS